MGGVGSALGASYHAHVPIYFGEDGRPSTNFANSGSTSAVTSFGSNGDMLCGVFLGFIVPWLPMLLLVAENATRTNRYFMLGIGTGVMCNLSLGVVRFVAFAQ